jgi:hypothetical protein
MITQMNAAVHDFPKTESELKILFLDDPFADWDMYFISRLALGRRPGEIILQRKHHKHLAPDEIAAFDVVLTADKQSIRRLK